MSDDHKPDAMQADMEPSEDLHNLIDEAFAGIEKHVRQAKSNLHRKALSISQNEFCEKTQQQYKMIFVIARHIRSLATIETDFSMLASQDESIQQLISGRDSRACSFYLEELKQFEIKCVQRLQGLPRDIGRIFFDKLKEINQMYSGVPFDSSNHVKEISERLNRCARLLDHSFTDPNTGNPGFFEPHIVKSRKMEKTYLYLGIRSKDGLHTMNTIRDFNSSHPSVSLAESLR